MGTFFKAIMPLLFRTIFSKLRNFLPVLFYLRLQVIYIALTFHAHYLHIDIDLSNLSKRLFLNKMFTTVLALLFLTHSCLQYPIRVSF